MVEKMKLVRVQGTMPQLNEFIGSCCMDGRFDLEPATRYMSESLGYGALNEENPHTAIRDQIETMAKEANMELHEGQQHSDPVDAEGRSYLSDLLEKIDDLCAERKVLLDQKKLCEDGIEQYSHFTGLKVNVDDILDCAHVKIRFGFLPTEGYNKLMNNYGDDPYILFTPCNQTKAGYWGVYMTPREHALETDGIFSMLYFEPVHVPGAAGSPAEIIEHFKENLDVVNKSVEDVNARIAALWQQNADKVQLLYNTACYYAAVYDLRRMAAVKGEHFFCVGWVPASEVDEVAGKARGIHGLRVTVDGPESAGKMTPPTKLKNLTGAQNAHQRTGDGMGAVDKLTAHKPRLSPEHPSKNLIQSVTAQIIIAIAGGTHQMRCADPIFLKRFQHLFRIFFCDSVNFRKNRLCPLCHKGAELSCFL